MVLGDREPGNSQEIFEIAKMSQACLDGSGSSPEAGRLLGGSLASLDRSRGALGALWMALGRHFAPDWWSQTSK